MSINLFTEEKLRKELKSGNPFMRTWRGNNDSVVVRLTRAEAEKLRLGNNRVQKRLLLGLAQVIAQIGRDPEETEVWEGRTATDRKRRLMKA